MVFDGDERTFSNAGHQPVRRFQVLALPQFFVDAGHESESRVLRRTRLKFWISGGVNLFEHRSLKFFMKVS